MGIRSEDMWAPHMQSQEYFNVNPKWFALLEERKYPI